MQHLIKNLAIIKRFIPAFLVFVFMFYSSLPVVAATSYEKRISIKYTAIVRNINNTVKEKEQENNLRIFNKINSAYQNGQNKIANDFSENIGNEDMINEILSIKPAPPPPKPAPKPNINVPVFEGYVFNPKVPLSDDLQRLAYNRCKEKNIRYELFWGMIKAESGFNPNCNTRGHLGLGQLSARYHYQMAVNMTGSSNLFDPSVNIVLSTEILGNYLAKFNGNEHMALMAYNAGGSGAQGQFNRGIYSTNYSNRVIRFSNEF